VTNRKVSVFPIEYFFDFRAGKIVETGSSLQRASRLGRFSDFF
jgi:hypothetical protein